MILDFIFATYVAEILFVLCFFGIICFFTENDHPFMALIAVIVGLISFEFFSSYHPIHWMISHYFQCIEYFILYVIAGTAYACGKWILFFNEAKRILENVINNASAKEIEIASKKGTRDDFIRHFASCRLDLIRFGVNDFGVPQISKNKSNFMTWMIYWPISMIWTLINDPLLHLFTWIYNNLGIVLQKIADKTFNKISIPKDLM